MSASLITRRDSSEIKLKKKSIWRVLIYVCRGVGNAHYLTSYRVICKTRTADFVCLKTNHGDFAYCCSQWFSELLSCFLIKLFFF